MPRSAAEGIAWPAMPDRMSATILALLHQLEQSQEWPPELIRRRQYAQLASLLRHAYDTVPFYRERLAGPGYAPGMEVNDRFWSRVPILTRAEAQATGDGLRSAAVPTSHGDSVALSTASSGGVGFELHRTDLAYMAFHACDHRWHLWHGLDLAKTLAVIRNPGRRASPAERARFRYPHGLVLPRWQQAAGHIYPTGACALLDVRTPPQHQIAWLARHQPAYLLTSPSNAHDLARYSREHGIETPWLEKVVTTGEALPSSLGADCRDMLGADLIDVYSCTEAGPLAAQCPQGDHYHVHAEAVLLEVVDAAGMPCRPGEVGRVLITPLHNFATVLLRYELGDHAEVGAAPECDLRLPVLARISGP